MKLSPTEQAGKSLHLKGWDITCTSESAGINMCEQEAGEQKEKACPQISFGEKISYSAVLYLLERQKVKENEEYGGGIPGQINRWKFDSTRTRRCF